MTTTVQDVSRTFAVTRRLHAVWVAMILAVGEVLTAGACSSDCEPTSTRQSCYEARLLDNPAHTTKITIAVSALEFHEADSVEVRVTAKNISGRTLVIPEQVCVRPFYVDLGTNTANKPGYICNGERYPGVTLAAGDSINWIADIRSETWEYGKHLKAGEFYLVYGRAKVGNGVAWTDTVAVRYLGP